MAFEKGRVRTGGKTKGIPNRNKRPFLEAVGKIMEWYDADKFITDLKVMSEVDRAKLILGIAEFAYPKLARSDNNKTITVQIEKAGFLLGGKVFYLDGTIPLQIEEHKEDNGA